MEQTTAKIVQREVLANPFLSDFLRRDLINVAGLARQLLPVVKKENPKATLESISVAIHRLPLKEQRVSQQLKEVVSHVQITMRTDISLFCMRKESKLPSGFGADDIFFVNQGATEVTVIIDEKNEHLIQGKPFLHRRNLAVVSLKDTLITKEVNYRITPGFVSIFLWSISKEGINIEDIISSYSQVTFLIEEKYLDKVYKICSDVKRLKYL
jgi:aspartokinase